MNELQNFKVIHSNDDVIIVINMRINTIPTQTHYYSCHDIK